MSLAHAPLLRLRLADGPKAGPAGQVVVTYLTDSAHLGSWPRAEIPSIDVTLPAEAADPTETWRGIEQLSPILSRLRTGQPWDDVLLLRISDVGLASHPWEDLGRRRRRHIIRYSPRPAAFAYEPIELPLSILFATNESEDDREAVATRYFRTVRTAHEGAAALLKLIAAGQFDVVHLTCKSIPSEDDPSRMTFSDGTMIEVPTLRRALLRSRTRLLVLEDQPGDAPSPARGRRPSLDGLRALAHRLHGASGVSVIATPQANFSDFYVDLTHDRPLSELVRRVVPRRPGQRPAIWLSQGADSALRLLGASARIAADVVREQRRLEAAQAAQAEMSRDRGIDLWDPATASALESVGRLRQRTYSFDREAHGYLPMTETDEQLRSLRETRAQGVPEPGRVVNTWLEKDERALPSSSSIASGAAYELAVSIGSHDPRSATTNPTSLDETAITEYDEAGFATLEVVVSSTGLGIDQPRQPLRLPPPPGTSETIRFRVQTPDEPGTFRLRVGVYHRTNLLQSLMMTLVVTPVEEPGHSPGYWAELEWALSSSLKNMEDLEEPALSILANEAPDGTHTFVLVGPAAGPRPGIHRQLDLPPDQLKTSIADTRADLQSVCSTLNKDGSLDEYLFDGQNRGTPKKLLGDLCTLALSGSGLFSYLTRGSDTSFREILRTCLRGSQLIQVASVKSANYVFPWSLVYDHEFRDGPSTVLCPTIGDILDSGGTADELMRATCFNADCPDRDNPRVVCPSGFWGFRHVIEQPLLTAPALSRGDPSDVDDDTQGTPRHDVVTDIPLSGAKNPEAVIAVSESLSAWSRHSNAAVKLFGGYAAVHSSIDDVLESMGRLDLHLAYFYCHGGRRRSTPFLGLGTNLRPDNLFPQYLGRITWPAQHPLVFINGCQTVGISPDDLLSFNEEFARAEAAGVLGTEISIPEALAQPVAIEFFEQLLQFEPVGRIVRRIRLGLLARRNPLGLAYTPYCMASLRLTP